MALCCGCSTLLFLMVVVLCVSVCARSLFVCALNWHQKAVTRLKDAGRRQTRQTYSAHRTSQEGWDRLQPRRSPGETDSGFSTWKIMRE